LDRGNPPPPADEVASGDGTADGGHVEGSADAEHVDETADVEPPEPARRVRVWRVVLSLAISAGLLVGVLPQLADLGEVWATVRALSPAWIAALLAGAAWNIATYQFVMMAALPGLSMGRAFVAGQLSTALANTLPAGAIVGVGVTYSVLRSFGHGTQAIAIAATVTGVWNTFAKLALPIIALALLALTGEASAAMTTTALVGLGILVAAVVIGGVSLTRESLAHATGARAGAVVSTVRGWLRRDPVEDWGERFAGFQRRSAGVLRDRWFLLTAMTLLSHVSLYLMLLLSLRAVGVDAEQVSAVQALGVFAFVRLVTALPITPGGLGVVELGMAAALTAAGGAPAPVVAAVLLYRALTYALQVPLGAMSWAVWRRQTRGAASPVTQ
jgi:putative heme transporter